MKMLALQRSSDNHKFWSHELDYALLIDATPRTAIAAGRASACCTNACARRSATARWRRARAWPPSRALAEELGMARNTVLYAYEQLATEGFVSPTGAAPWWPSGLAGAHARPRSASRARPSAAARLSRARRNRCAPVPGRQRSHGRLCARRAGAGDTFR
jgi:GntR family transcriptional regulator/MocR family aminotransferase